MNMVETKFIDALEIIAQKLEKEHIKWALVGSVSLALQGMDFNPHDLDILLTFKDLSRIPILFSEYNPTGVTKLKPIVNDDTSDVKLNINGVNIQIFAENNDSGIYASRLLAHKLITLEINGLKIPCFTLEASSQTYADTKRQEKAERINEFIKKRTNKSKA
jgi:predicted nucleotidyltransferase